MPEAKAERKADPELAEVDDDKAQRKKERKERKRKRKEREADEKVRVEEEEKPVEPEGDSGKKKKKKRRKEFSDPTEDDSLEGQARKALVYAYTQFSDPTSWKFHKARQNWLIRNMWSDQAIPEKYTSLLVRYLVNVQGGIRDNLVKACNAVLSPTSTDTTPAEVSNTSTESEPKNSTPVVPTPSPSEGIKQTRARAILDTLNDTSAQ